jgi:signal transduction histidine kinase
MSDIHHDQPAERLHETRRRGVLVLRTLPILLIPMVVALVTLAILRLTSTVPIGPPTRPPPLSPLIPIIVIVIFSSALVILVRLGRPTISALTLIGVWTLVTTVAWSRSGVTTYFPALLILPICAAGLLLDRVASISLAILATILVGSIAWLESQGLLVWRNDLPDALRLFLDTNRYGLAVGFWVGLFITVAALTSLLAGGLQRALQQSYAQAAELRQLSSQLETRVAEQTAALLEQEREAAMLEERTRLAREIHDTIAQGLAGVSVQLGAAQRALAVAPEEAGEHLALAQQMARESLAEARRSVWNLRAPALERGDLGDALRGLVERQRSTGRASQFEQRGTPWPLHANAEAALLRVTQEALANVAKHTQATRIEVVLEFTPDAVRLTIRDNGSGFDTAILSGAVEPKLGSGLGLLGMRERLAQLGGRLTLHNGQGAVIEAVVPRDDGLKVSGDTSLSR